MSDQVTRMLNEAEARLHDADLLELTLQSEGSEVFLKVLALEILLKAAQVQASGSATRSHRYVELWQNLPSAVRESVLVVAKDRYPGHADLSNVTKLLCVYEFLFTQARYEYELYERYTLAEQKELGDHWVARGAPIEEADIQYFPLELSALVEGLRMVVRSGL